jgi:hypothetical protein
VFTARPLDAGLLARAVTGIRLRSQQSPLSDLSSAFLHQPSIKMGLVLFAFSDISFLLQLGAMSRKSLKLH